MVLGRRFTFEYRRIFAKITRTQMGKPGSEETLTSDRHVHDTIRHQNESSKCLKFKNGRPGSSGVSKNRAPF
ncbi:unnamed protein product, partial [Mesorhabditis spiculigera]